MIFKVFFFKERSSQVFNPEFPGVQESQAQMIVTHRTDHPRMETLGHTPRWTVSPAAEVCSKEGA
jgi:hypothetical protein